MPRLGKAELKTSSVHKGLVRSTATAKDLWTGAKNMSWLSLTLGLQIIPEGDGPG